jgi:Fe-Mn family superoxide dismutase
MEIHHDRHHAGYTKKLNAALEGHGDWHDRSIAEILGAIDSVPESVRTAVRNNGGGFTNHDLFWKVMSPNGGGVPSGELGDAIAAAFGSFDAFKETFSSTAASQFGSGWGWLVLSDGALKIYSTPNQDSPYMNHDVPLMGVDVWEHAYYLNYQNARGDYLAAWWNVVNWDEVAARYSDAK